jgi:hypothetical protein
MAAADRARAAEGPQMLGSISRMQHAYRVGMPGFLVPIVATDVDEWQTLGFDNVPRSNFFDFSVDAGGTADVTFIADALAKTPLTGVGTLRIDQHDRRRTVNGTGTNVVPISRLVPSWDNEASVAGTLGEAALP